MKLCVCSANAYQGCISSNGAYEAQRTPMRVRGAKANPRLKPECVGGEKYSMYGCVLI